MSKQALKLTVVGLGILVIGLLGVGCGDKGANSEDHSSELVGIWAAVTIEGALDPNGDPAQVDGSMSSIEFKSDKTYYWYLNAPPWYVIDGTGTFNYDGSTITVTGPIAEYLGVSSFSKSRGSNSFTFLDNDQDRWAYERN